MILVFILLLLLIFSSAIAGAKEKERLDAQSKKGGLKASVVSEDIPKVCPPHKWFHQEVKDLEGNTVKWRMVCELCGPLKPLG